MEKFNFIDGNNTIYDIFVGSNKEILEKRKNILIHNYMNEISYHVEKPFFKDGIQYCLILRDSEIYGFSLYIESLIKVARMIEEKIFTQGDVLDRNPLWNLINPIERKAIQSTFDRMTCAIETYNSAIVENKANIDLSYLLQNCYIAMRSITELSWDFSQDIESDGFCQIRYFAYGVWVTPLIPWDEEKK